MSSRVLVLDRSVTFLIAVFLLGAITAWAGISGTISGVIRDPSGALVPEAEITILNVATGITQVARTDFQGGYSFLALPVGRYQLSVKHTGFKSYEQTDIVLNANDALRLDVTLQVGQVAQAVEVAASAVHVETTSTQMGDVIGASTMISLPLNGRNFTDLLGLQPGVAPQSVGTVASGVMGPNYGTQFFGNISVSGGREDSNGFQINGASVVDPSSNGTTIIPNLDSIAEFRVLTNNVDAEYGQFSGGLINIVTKSGTNQFHGDVFEFVRNDVFDARNFFDIERGSFKQNQFGATLGGPIVHDKVFFFGDYQGTRQVRGLSSGENFVPSTDERNGLFDPSSLSGLVNGSYWANTLSQRLGYAVTSGEPYAGCTSTAACVFPNGIIPTSAFAPAGKTLISQIPLADDGPYFVGLNDTSVPDDRGSIRVDATNRLGMFSVYYFIDNINSITAYGTNNLPGFPTGNPDGSQQVNLGYTKAFGGSKLNEFRANYTRYNNWANEPANAIPSLESQGFNVSAPSGNLLGDPTIGVTGVGGLGYYGAINRVSNSIEVLDNFADVIGSHSLKLGGDFQFVKWYFFTVGYALQASFSGTETGSPIADVLLGAPSQSSETTTNDTRTQAHYAGLYAQDSWRLRPNLTLNYGVRWDVPQPWGDPRGISIATVILGEQSKVFPTAPTGMVYPGDPGVSQGISPTRYDNIAPRIGLAYSPSASGGFWGWLLGGPGKSSLRASFGSFYDSLNNYGLFFNCAPPPYALYYYAPGPLLENPFITRSSGTQTPDPYPFTRPKPGANVNFAPFEPISGWPFPSVSRRTPYVEQYSLSVQLQIKTNSLLTLSYVGNGGHHLLTNLEANPGNGPLCLTGIIHELDVFGSAPPPRYAESLRLSGSVGPPRISHAARLSRAACESEGGHRPMERPSLSA